MDIMHAGENQLEVSGEGGTFTVHKDDEAAWKLMMLIEAECSEETHAEVVSRYGYSTQRFYQLRKAYREEGTDALRSQKTGPKTNYRRGGEVMRQIVRYRFLNPEVSAEVVGKKLRQKGFQVSDRSVYRVFEEFGLQKKGSISAALRKISNRLK
mgnify:FL=1